MTLRIRALPDTCFLQSIRTRSINKQEQEDLR